MKRLIILVLAVFLVLIVLASCQKDDFNKDSSHQGEAVNTDTSTNTDLNTDTSTDTSDDTNTNTDTSTDTNTDTSTDTSTDTNTGTDTDTNTDTNTDISIDTSTDIVIDESKLIRGEYGLLYMIKDDNTLILLAYETYEGMTLSVPSKVEEYTVTEIAPYAFSGYGEITEIFSSPSGFVTIRLPETITKIGKGAFSNCLDIKVQLNTTNATITREEWVEILEIVPDDEHDKSNAGCNCHSCHQVLDTIVFKRPAIGWGIYVK